MTLIDETFAASYKGATFLVSKATTAGGRKDVLHQYPNSNRQNVEDLGLKPRTVSLEAVVTSPNYTQKKNRLLDALESGGTGLLVHPFFGNLENMACRTFSLNETYTELGEAKINMVFTISDNVATPVGTKNNASYLNGLNTVAQDAMNADVAKGFNVGGSASLFEKAKDLVDAAFDKIDDATKIVAEAKEFADEFSALLNDVTTNINNLVRLPQDLADSFQNVISNINGLYAVATGVSVTGNQSVTTAENQSIQSTKTLAVYSAMFDFGDDAVEIPNTTAQRVRENLNNCLIQQQMQLSALGYAYLNSAQINYSTVAEIDEVADMIETQFQKVLVNNDFINELVELTFENIDIDQTTILAVQDLRDATQSFFDDIKLTTSRVIEVETTEMSASLLAFQYYGSTALETEIIELNPEKNVSFFSDDVKILSQ
jgi:prophage DNA circulation protein